MRNNFGHEFDSSMTCDFCGCTEEGPKAKQKCDPRYRSDNTCSQHSNNKPQSSSISSSAAEARSHRKTEARAVVENAIRWCCNIIVEVQNNHTEHLTVESKKKLRELATLIQTIRIN